MYILTFSIVRKRNANTSPSPPPPPLNILWESRRSLWLWLCLLAFYIDGIGSLKGGPTTMCTGGRVHWTTTSPSVRSSGGGGDDGHCVIHSRCPSCGEWPGWDAAGAAVVDDCSANIIIEPLEQGGQQSGRRRNCAILFVVAYLDCSIHTLFVCLA